MGILVYLVTLGLQLQYFFNACRNVTVALPKAMDI